MIKLNFDLLIRNSSETPSEMLCLEENWTIDLSHV